MRMLGWLFVFWLSQFLAFPPWSVFVLSPLYIALFFHFAGEAPSPRQAFDRLFLMVLPFWAFQVRWIANLPVFPEQHTPLVSAVLFLVIWKGLFLGGMAAAYRALRTGILWKDLFLAASLWTLMEWLRTTGDLRFLWAPLWSTVLPYPMLAAPMVWIGPFGWTFLWVLGSVAAGLALARRSWHTLLWSLLVGTVIGTATAAFHLPPPVGHLRAMVVQPAYLPGRFGSLDPFERDSLLQRYRRLLNHIPDSVDLLLFPETAFPGLYSRDTAVQRFLDSLQREHPIPVAFGMSTTPDTAQFPRIVHNSVILRLPGDPVLRVYHKRILVPFGEMFPLEDRFPMLGILDLRHQPLLPGATPPILKVHDTLTLGVAICYEVLFPDALRRAVRRGAHVLVNLSNDAWFGEGLGPEELLDLSRFRALETGRALIRVGREGGGALILPDGTIVDSLPRGRMRTKVWRVPLYTHVTLYARIGDGPFLGLAFLLVLVFGLQQRRNVEGPPSDAV